MTVETAETKPLSIGDIRSSIASGESKANAIAEASFEKIEARDPLIHAYLSTNRERALEHASQIDDLAAKGEPLPVLAGEVSIGLPLELARSYAAARVLLDVGEYSPGGPYRREDHA